MFSIWNYYILLFTVLREATICFRIALLCFLKLIKLINMVHHYTLKGNQKHNILICCNFFLKILKSSKEIYINIDDLLQRLFYLV